MSIFTVQRGATAKIENKTVQSAQPNLIDEARAANKNFHANREGKHALINAI